MLSLRCSMSLYGQFLADMRGEYEQVGFFLVSFIEGVGFELLDWRSVPPDGFERQTKYHVTLSDDAQSQAIQWAFDSGLCLVEAHTHRLEVEAAFSFSDKAGLWEWVPHVRWRLSKRPYAAIVVANDSWDGLAWVDGIDDVRPLVSWQVDDRSIAPPTGQGFHVDEERWTSN